MNHEEFFAWHGEYEIKLTKLAEELGRRPYENELSLEFIYQMFAQRLKAELAGRDEGSLRESHCHDTY